MSDANDLARARAVLHEFDLGPLKPLDVDDVIRRGHRRRRAAFVQGVAAVLVVVFGVAAVQSRVDHTPLPATTSPLNKYMNLLALSQSFYPSNGTTLSLSQTRTINGIPTVALTSDVEGAGGVFVEVRAPYQPVLGESANHLLRETFGDWDAPAPKLPSTLSAAEVYEPSG